MSGVPASDVDIVRRAYAALAALRPKVARGPLALSPSWRRAVSGVALIGVLVFACLQFESSLALFDELLVALFLALTAVGTTTLVWMLHAWRSGDSLGQTRFPALEREPVHSFSLILPARHEQAVLAATLAKLAEQRHPAFEVIVVVGHDDPGTRAVAEAAIAGDERFHIVVDTNEPKNKPKALNTALPSCRGDIVGVFDAEDQVAPDLLRVVDQCFQERAVEVVQGATQLMNFDSSWFSVRNVLEYYFWFKSRLHFHAAAGFIPLGGNTVFVRRDWLERAGGWDERCLAEDCDLGSRLSSLGARTLVAYSPQLVTREETPESVRALVRQRTRWNQGFLQVLRKGEWKRLPVRARLLAAYTLAFPFLQAASALVLPLAIATILWHKLPILLALLSFLPYVPLAAILVVELLGLAEFGREFELRPRLRHYALLMVGLIPYQLLLAVAASRAVCREIRGICNWEKTAHVGAHLSSFAGSRSPAARSLPPS
jgi:cellulose synthase/poly-beta-1,6-N-acetylglucosamine synthase-like glycosyltransferase